MVPMGILLVDETDELLKSCRVFFDGKTPPIDVASATSLGELFKRKLIDIVVVSSYDLTASLSSLKQTFPSTAFILGTREFTRANILAALQSGFDDVLKMPLDSTEFFAALCRISHERLHDGAPEFELMHTNNLSALDKRISSTSLRARLNGKWTEPLAFARQLISPFMQGLPFKRRDQTKAIEHAPEHKGQNAFGVSVHPLQASQGFAEAELRAFFFGHFHVQVNNHAIEKWPSRKARLLFAYLLLNRKHALCRDVLMEKFWPNTQASSGRDSLNVAMHIIRHTIHSAGATENPIVYKDECYSINPERAVWIDVEEFSRHRQLSHRGEARINLPTMIRELESARRLYVGEFMEEDLYDDWVTTERENLREMYLDTLDRLSECYVLSNNPSAAAQLCERVLEKDNCREDIHRRLMVCYSRMGFRDKALRQYKKCEVILKAELEVEPTKQTRQLYLEIRNDRLSSTHSKS
jgi:DNA-binding SARP family transcriptional activator